MLEWEKLLSPARRKTLHSGQELMSTGAGRTELERDYDRILFATPTRRLADKTQVFPMEENDSVRTRLTHSHEVSNLARSIGIQLAFIYPEKIFGQSHERLDVKRNVPALLAAVGLAHDLGNPPFGHQGETAIQQWFQENSSENIEADFTEFDGNAQTFRLLTRLQLLNDQFGLNLTIATLSALIKYPTIYGGSDKFERKKDGIFRSEAEIVNEVWEHTGLKAGVRHPLAYVMEACDDIAYSVIDAEDTVKKGYASFYDLMDYLETANDNDSSINDIVKKSREQNEKFKNLGLSSRELNEVSMQMFRVKAISEMVTAATETFVQYSDEIMTGRMSGKFELIKESKCTAFCKATKNFDRLHGFNHRDVLRLELQGSNYIKNTMTMLWKGIKNAENLNDPFEKYAYESISENYRRIYEKTEKSNYNKRQLLCDAISGMTESYLVKKHDELKSLANEH